MQTLENTANKSKLKTSQQSSNTQFNVKNERKLKTEIISDSVSQRRVA